MTITERIKPLEYFNWGTENIFLQAPTGSGKSFFVLHHLFRVAWQRGTGLLILCHRENLIQQYERDIQKLASEQIRKGFFLPWPVQAPICVASYQKVAGGNFIDKIIANFGIIVCDEVHALYSDSQFATNLCLAYEKLILWSENRLMLFMTATGEHIFPLLYQRLSKGKPVFLSQPLDWEHGPELPGCHYIAADYSYLDVCYLRRLEQIYPVLKRDKDTEDKWLIFVSSVKEGKMILEKLKPDYKERIFLLTRATAQSEDGKELSAQLAASHNFDYKIVVSTVVLEAGVSIWDEKVRNVVNLQYSQEAFIQTLGRKRVHEKERLRLYILNRGQKFFAGKYNECKQILKEIDEINRLYCPENTFQGYISQKLLEPGDNRYLKKFIYYCFGNGYGVNPISIIKVNNDKKFFGDTIQKIKNDNTAFIKIQLLWLGLESSYNPEKWLDEEDVLECRKQIAVLLNQKGDSWMDVKAFSVFKTEIANIMHEFFPDVVSRGNRPLATKKLTECLERLKLPFQIIEGQRNRKKAFWIIHK